MAIPAVLVVGKREITLSPARKWVGFRVCCRLDVGLLPEVNLARTDVEFINIILYS